MLLSSLETTDAALFGAVVQGDVTDDGAPVGCEVLAMALELHRLGADVAAGLTAWRPGEPWELWVDAAVAEGAELRPRAPMWPRSGPWNARSSGTTRRGRQGYGRRS